MNTADRIEIPYNSAGIRCFEVFSKIAMKQLQRAREAAKSFMPTAEIVEENAMCNGKYTALMVVPDGGQRSVIYDYRTKIVEIEG